MRERLGGAIAPTLAFTAVLVLWQGSVWLLRPPPFILPGIGQVIARLVAFGPNWAGHVVATIEGIALGFLDAVVFGTAGDHPAAGHDPDRAQDRVRPPHPGLVRDRPHLAGHHRVPGRVLPGPGQH